MALVLVLTIWAVCSRRAPRLSLTWSPDVSYPFNLRFSGPRSPVWWRLKLVYFNYNKHRTTVRSPQPSIPWPGHTVTVIKKCKQKNSKETMCQKQCTEIIAMVNLGFQDRVVSRLSFKVFIHFLNDLVLSIQ